MYVPRFPLSSRGGGGGWYSPGRERLHTPRLFKLVLNLCAEENVENAAYGTGAGAAPRHVGVGAEAQQCRQNSARTENVKKCRLDWRTKNHRTSSDPPVCIAVGHDANREWGYPTSPRPHMNMLGILPTAQYRLHSSKRGHYISTEYYYTQHSWESYMHNDAWECTHC